MAEEEAGAGVGAATEKGAVECRHRSSGSVEGATYPFKNLRVSTPSYIQLIKLSILSDCERAGSLTRAQSLCC